MVSLMPSPVITLIDLTPTMRAQICNGCGSKAGRLSFIRPPQGHAQVHCDAHDLAYWLGIGTRLAADLALLRGMLGDATGREWWQRPGFRCKAVIFFCAVRIGGGASFNRGRPRGWAELRELDPFAPPLPLRAMAPMSCAHDPDWGVPR